MNRLAGAFFRPGHQSRTDAAAFKIGMDAPSHPGVHWRRLIHPDFDITGQASIGRENQAGVRLRIEAGHGPFILDIFDFNLIDAKIMLREVVEKIDRDGYVVAGCRTFSESQGNAVIFLHCVFSKGSRQWIHFVDLAIAVQLARSLGVKLGLFEDPQPGGDGDQAH